MDTPRHITQAADVLRRCMAQLEVGQTWRLRTGHTITRLSLSQWELVNDHGVLTGTVGQIVSWALSGRIADMLERAA